MTLIVPVAISLTFVGCCSNVLFLEYFSRYFPNSGQLITFTAFIFNMLEGLIFGTRFFTKRRFVPLRRYICMVTLFFTVQTLNNHSMRFNVPMPLVLVFRSGSLVANLIVGSIALRRRYKFSKYLSVVMISCGIVICTLASARHAEHLQTRKTAPVYGVVSLCQGILTLILTLFLSACMGVFQENTCMIYGKHPSEALFYNHFLPLPLFVAMSGAIYDTALEISLSDPVIVPVIKSTMPEAWLMLLGNTISQYICIKAVFILTTECTSLTVTLVVTLRKFVSLVFSIVIFKNTFTHCHWLGFVLVFAGTVIFTDILSSQQNQAQLHNKEKKD